MPGKHLIYSFARFLKTKSMLKPVNTVGLRLPDVSMTLMMQGPHQTFCPKTLDPPLATTLYCDSLHFARKGGIINTALMRMTSSFDC